MLARDKIAFFTLFHSPSGAGYTPKGRETMKETRGGNQLNLFTVEERTCGSSGSDSAWGVCKGWYLPPLLTRGNKQAFRTSEKYLLVAHLPWKTNRKTPFIKVYFFYFVLREKNNPQICHQKYLGEGDMGSSDEKVPCSLRLNIVLIFLFQNNCNPGSYFYENRSVCKLFI